MLRLKSQAPKLTFQLNNLLGMLSATAFPTHVSASSRTDKSSINRCGDVTTNRRFVPPLHKEVGTQE
ncbi:hypothetical protein E2C01_096722 [Portunus trituberculatus]|uniref:Uncharacterized protein n=1 Tax=Portunus trituberculatus TaxID=210409 RepID=A0A5B7K3M2_PORTR|nr:hypothetical protein [Portunus trituberculatus]